MNTIISQALATGLPVITTRHSGIPDQVKDGESGFLVDEGDYQALAEKIIYMIEHPEQWGGFGKFGRAHVLEHYDSARLMKKQIEFYDEVLRES